MRLGRRLFCVFVFVLCTFHGNAEAAEKIRVGVFGFESRTPNVSDRQAESIADIFTRELAGSRTISVYERQQLDKVGEEIRRNASGLVDVSAAIEVGKLAGVQYVLLGSVMEVSRRPYNGGRQVTATIDVRVIYTATSEVRLALSETGFAADSSAGSTSAIGGEIALDSLDLKAVSDAINRLSYVIRSNLGQESAHVVAVNNSGYVIDIGVTMGVREGALYLVYSEGEPIIGMNNEMIGNNKFSLAILKVAKVENTHSVCVLEPGSRGDLVERGDKIEPISQARATATTFATSRSGTASSTRPAPAAKKQVAPPVQQSTSAPAASPSSQPTSAVPEPKTAPVATKPRPTPESSSETVAQSSKSASGALWVLMDSPKESTTADVTELIRQGADVNYVKDGRPPLLNAVLQNQSADVLRALIDNGANIHVDVNLDAGRRGSALLPSIKGGTLLHAAAVYSTKFHLNLAVMRLLIERGVDAKAKDSSGRTAYDLAKKNRELATRSGILGENFEKLLNPSRN